MTERGEAALLTSHTSHRGTRLPEDALVAQTFRRRTPWDPLDTTVYGAAQSTDPPPAGINAPSLSEVTESAGADAVRSPYPSGESCPRPLSGPRGATRSLQVRASRSLNG